MFSHQKGSFCGLFLLPSERGTGVGLRHYTLAKFHTLPKLTTLIINNFLKYVMYGRFANAHLNKTLPFSSHQSFSVPSALSKTPAILRVFLQFSKIIPAILQNNQPKNPRNSLESKVNANPCATYLPLDCGHLKEILQSIFLVFHPQKVLF